MPSPCHLFIAGAAPDNLINIEQNNPFNNMIIAFDFVQAKTRVHYNNDHPEFNQELRVAFKVSVMLLNYLTMHLLSC